MAFGYQPPAINPTTLAENQAAAQGFSVAAYLQEHPDILANYVSGDPAPNGQTYQQVYGSLANYVIADATANGNAMEKQQIATGALQPDAKQPDTTLLPALGYTQQGGQTQTGVPIEQAALNTVLPSINSQLNQAPQYSNLAQALLNQSQGAYGNLNQVLQQGAQTVDVQKFFQQNPAAAQAFAATGGVVPGQNNGQPMTAAQFATYYAQANGITLPVTSPLTQQQNDAVKQAAAAATAAQSAQAAQQVQAAQQAASSDLSGLQTAVASMQTSLTGELQGQAAAVAQNLATLQQNIGQFGSQESQALTTQINQQLADLQTSIASQKSALEQQIQTLQGATDTESQQQLAAVQSQLQTLNAAEAPVAAARTQAAQAQVTAVNIGLAQTKNQINARSALQGFVGGSTLTDNALLNASIGAAQQGAAAVGGANLQNAQDYQAIQDLGAQQSNAIQQAIAQQKYNLTNQGATGAYNLATALASGTQGLQDTGAAGQAAIQGQVAGQLEQAGNTAAGQTYQNTTAGLAAQNALANALAQGTANIGSTQAGQVQNITNTQAQNTGQIATTAAQQQEQNALNSYNNALQAALGQASIPANQASSIPGIANVANAATNNALNTLNWWSAPATPTIPGALATTPSTMGTSLSTIGSGLLGAGLQAGNASNWWQQPTGAQPGVGASTTYQNFLNENPTSSAATGGG